MGRRELNERDKDKLRDKIRADRIISVLQHFILGTQMKHPDGKMRVPKMTPMRIQACRILLSKVLPDLKSEEIVATVESHRRVISEKPVTAAEWQEKYGGGDNVVPIDG